MTDPVLSKELTEAIAIANRLLDEPFADPDDDARTVARQFLRGREAIERLQRELARVTGEREPPHCSSCACGLAAEPPAEPFGFVAALAVADRVFTQYREDQPKWWKRMDGTPILNDVSVRMAQAFLEAIHGPAQPPRDG